MRRSLRNLNIACDHTGRAHFGGSYFFHEFVRVLHTQNFLAAQIRYASPTGVEFTGRSHWKAEATLVKINRLLHKSGEQMPIFGKICTKRLNFTPDLGSYARQRGG